MSIADRDLAAAHPLAVGHHTTPPVTTLGWRDDVRLQPPKTGEVRIEEALPRLIAEKHGDLLDARFLEWVRSREETTVEWIGEAARGQD